MALRLAARAFFLGFGIALATSSSGAQGPRAAPTADTPRFRVGIDVIRVDAVVTTRQGEVVGDLKPSDFEILQDGKPQTLLVADYIATTGAAADRSHSVGFDGPSIRPTALQVQRTIALVVDDLGLSWESLGPTRKVLEAFVDGQMLPGNLVGVLRTSTFSGALQQFTATAAASDRSSSTCRSLRRHAAGSSLSS
jgi:VWFA-related protein